MSDALEPGGSTDAPLNDPAAAGAYEGHLDDQAPADDAGPSMAEIDREVAEAMGSMDPNELAELGGEIAMNDAGAIAETVEPGTELVGTVVHVTEDEIHLEFGPKSQGILPRAQFGKKEVLHPGRRVDVVVDKFDADSGMLLVYRKGALQRATWTNLAVGMIVEGKVSGVIKGGLEVDLKGIRAFMPGSQVDTAPMKDISLLLNETVRCEVIELDRRGKNVLLSRRKVQEREQAEAREKLKSELEVGQVRAGVVKTIMSYGAFVDLGGIDGLVHIRDLSWGSVENVTDVLASGQEIQVQVLRIDHERNRISLGLKQCLPDPWVGVGDRYPAGTALKVRIVRLADFGAFAELETGIEGLIPISEMGWTRLRQTSDAVSTGDLVDAVVIRTEPEKRRIALSMKQAQPDPWAGVLDTFTEKEVTKGKVTRLADFGAFVEIAPGVEGLIHISELADHHVRSCQDVLQVGQDVEARVLGIDKENRRISLSIKALTTHAMEERVAQEAPKKPQKRKKPLRGGLSSHFDW